MDRLRAVSAKVYRTDLQGEISLTTTGKLKGDKLYEIKTALTARACLRDAFGQLLEYAFWPGAQEPTRFIVVGETAVDEEAREYLHQLRKRFSLPIEYETIEL